MSVLSILQLAQGKAVLEYDPYYSDVPLPGPEPVEVDDDELLYCRNKGWVRIRHVNGSYEMRTNVFESCVVTEMTLTKQGKVELYEQLADAKDKPKETTKRKRTGRPRKEEKDGDTKVVAALAVYHQYEPGGSVGRYDAASLKDLAKLSGLSKATISRFFKSEFKDGYEGYKAACLREEIGLLLAKWQGEMPEYKAGLLPEEYGRREDD